MLRRKQLSIASRHGLAKYDYDSTRIRDLFLKITKKKKEKIKKNQRYIIGYVSFVLRLPFIILLFYIVFSSFVLFPIFLLSIYSTLGRITYSKSFLEKNNGSSKEHGRSLFCAVNPVTVKISLDCDQVFL